MHNYAQKCVAGLVFINIYHFLHYSLSPKFRRYHARTMMIAERAHSLSTFLGIRCYLFHINYKVYFTYHGDIYISFLRYIHIIFASLSIIYLSIYLRSKSTMRVSLSTENRLSVVLFPPKISTQYRICITDVSAIRCIHYPRYFAFPHRQRILDALPYYYYYYYIVLKKMKIAIFDLSYLRNALTKEV